MFFVENYPLLVAEGDFVAGVAKGAGTYTYPMVSGGSSTIHTLDLGLIADEPVPVVLKPLTPEERQEVREKVTRILESDQAELFMALVSFLYESVAKERAEIKRRE